MSLTPEQLEAITPPCDHCRNPTPHTVCRCYYPKAAPEPQAEPATSGEVERMILRLEAGSGGGKEWQELHRSAAALLRQQAQRIAELEGDLKMLARKYQREHELAKQWARRNAELEAQLEKEKNSSNTLHQALEWLNR